ncbi:hypothetical protein MMC29_001390 [Sticta canariensis]|nr:hypothetical protein [Sticta canariensis]
MPENSIENAPGQLWDQNLALLTDFVLRFPHIIYFRLQILDFTSTLRVRIVPKEHLMKVLKERKLIGIAPVILGLLCDDTPCPGFSGTGEYKLFPKFESLRPGARQGYATVQCELQEPDGEEVSTCPRTCLRRLVNDANEHGLEFLVGFEIEVVFMKCGIAEGEIHFQNAISQGHAYCTSRPLQDDFIMRLIERILARLRISSIAIQQFHAESAPCQFEFVLDPLPPLAAVDTLLSAREIISSVANESSMRATLIPKPYSHTAGTGAHIHFSFTPPQVYERFYAGVLEHLRSIVAVTYPHSSSYERLVDSAWAGGTWVSWGKQNRETPLRQIEGSHFEFKCVDGLANMYLALSIIIAAGLQGVLENQRMTMGDCLVDPSKLSEAERNQLGISQKIPGNIAEALDHLQADSKLRKIMGNAVIDNYLTVKKAEMEKFEKMEPGKRRNWLIERY